MSELLEKANPGIVIALCGNKVDLEERQVTQEVLIKFIKIYFPLRKLLNSLIKLEAFI